MCTLSQEEKDKIKHEQEDKDRRQNCKQHCTKIAQGLDKLDEYSSARAIWELVQNARDLSNDCEIMISLSESEFMFAHKGKPFTYDSLCSLVKQVSSEEKEDADNNPVGQYGTGFISTHSFSRIIYIDGSFKIKDGIYVDINDFPIDREFDSIEEFIAKMSCQIKYVEQLVDHPTTSNCKEWTKLKYILNNDSFPKAQKGLDEAKKVIPFVLTLNDRIKKVTISDNNGTIEYCKREMSVTHDNLRIMPIAITQNGLCKIQSCYFLESEDKKDKIIMPLETPTKAISFKNFPKLFLFFPLLGTENFGMNFIFHSERFYPVEARNGIFLPNKEKTAEAKYEANVKVINEMTDMLLGYLSQNIANISNSVEFSSIRFETLSTDEKQNVFFKSLKEKWVSSFIDYQLIETENGKFSISQTDCVKVLKKDIISWLKDDTFQQYLPSIYSYAQSYSNLPKINEIIKWSEIVYGWDDKTENYYISLDNIAGEIKTDSERLHSFLEFIVKCQKTDFFNKYPIIPNREGNLLLANKLKNAETINTDLYRVARKIIPEITDSYVSFKYADIYKFPLHNRENLRDAINTKIHNISRIDKGYCFDSEFENSVTEYCSIFTTANGTSQRNKLMPIVCEMCGRDYNETIVEKSSPDESDLFETAFKYIVENQMLKIDQNSNNWDEEKMDVLNRFLRECVSTETFKKNQLPKYCIFPNQNGNLCKLEDLRISNGIDSDLIEYYQRAVNMDLKDELIREDFKELVNFEKYEPKEVAKKIEEKLEESKYHNQLTIDIIEKIEEKDNWKGIFKYIEEHKEELFFGSVQGNDKKNVYKLMKKDSDTLQLLADMSDNPNAKAILNKAKELIEREKYKQLDFEFKHAIGVRIEELIQEKLNKEIRIEQASVDDIQNGQDLIVSYKNKAIYYIEVKTKWNFTEPAHMSKNQMKKAYANKNCYALCCVDLTNELVEEHFYPDVDDVVRNTYIHTDIGEKLTQIMYGVSSADRLDDDTSIKMDGDYRCNIPKKVFVEGTPFDSLIDAIAHTINQLSW